MPEDNSYVIDCNVVIKWFIKKENEVDDAIVFLEKARENKLKLYSPKIMLVEFANVMTKYRSLGILSKKECLDFFRDVLSISNQSLLTLVPLGNYTEEILNMAIEEKISYYDAEYLYLSRKLNFSLITFDKKLMKVASR